MARLGSQQDHPKNKKQCPHPGKIVHLFPSPHIENKLVNQRHFEIEIDKKGNDKKPKQHNKPERCYITIIKEQCKSGAYNNMERLPFNFRCAYSFHVLTV